MKLAVFMDPLAYIKPVKDSTVAMIKSAQQLGLDCYFFTQNDLYCRDGQAFARVSTIHIGDESSPHWAKTTDKGEKPLTDFNIILVRKDPPFTMDYIYATYLLELAERAGVMVVNKPQSLRDANEKVFTMHFPTCTPKTLVSSDKTRLTEFWRQHQRVIFKPLDGMGGQGVFQILEDGRNTAVIIDLLTKQQTTPIMAQQYIPDILITGDKRILMIDGQPVPYALARMPAALEIRGNLAAGGTGVVVPLTAKDHWICEQIGETLRAKGLLFVGIDVIGDYLTEINVTSPTCIREISKETGLDIATDYLNQLLTRYLRDKS